MPVYCYRVGKKIIEKTFPIGLAPECIVVGKRIAKRDFQAERKSFPPAKGWPMTCFASGVNANQAQELRDFLEKKGVPTEVTPDGDPIYKNATHRKKALKARGLFDKNAYI